MQRLLLSNIRAMQCTCARRGQRCVCVCVCASAGMRYLYAQVHPRVQGRAGLSDCAQSHHLAVHQLAVGACLLQTQKGTSRGSCSRHLQSHVPMLVRCPPTCDLAPLRAHSRAGSMWRSSVTCSSGGGRMRWSRCVGRGSTNGGVEMGLGEGCVQWSRCVGRGSTDGGVEMGLGEGRV